VPCESPFLRKIVVNDVIFIHSKVTG